MKTEVRDVILDALEKHGYEVELYKKGLIYVDSEEYEESIVIRIGVAN